MNDSYQGAVSGDVTETEKPVRYRALSGARILIVDDDEQTGRSLERVLQICEAKVTLLSTPEAAAKAIERQAFDAAVVDYHLMGTADGATGLPIVARLLSVREPCCALMITGDISKDRGMEAMAVGAHDFLRKPFEIDSFLNAVDETVRRTSSWRARLAQKNAIVESSTISPEQPELRDGLPDLTACLEELAARGALSTREKAVLAQLLAGKRNREAAEAMGVTERTVKYHVGRLLKKFNVSSRVELFGLLFSEGRLPVNETADLEPEEED